MGRAPCQFVASARVSCARRTIAAVPDIDPQALTAPCPCDTCRHAAKCRTEKLLCGAFSLYVAGDGKRRWSIAPRVPTRALYDALLEVEARPVEREVQVRQARLPRRRR